MAAAHDCPFTRSFSSWFASAIDLRDVMVMEPCVDRDAVNIKFLMGGDALHGHAYASGISIAANWKGECWDLMLDQDLVAARDAHGWHCTLCPEQDRPHFNSIEDLWVDHLFQPLRDWATIQLIPARAIGFYVVGGVTWAKLLADDQVDDPPVHRVQLTQSTDAP